MRCGKAANCPTCDRTEKRGKVKYVNGKPKGVEKVVLAVPHDPKIEKEQVKADLFAKVVKPVLAKYGYKIDKKDLIVNGTGRWEIGGPASDTGVTGRKIIVDSYGGMARIGGGAFSGKDPTKVDRSGAYAARYVAKILSPTVWQTGRKSSWPTSSAIRNRLPKRSRLSNRRRSRRWWPISLSRNFWICRCGALSRAWT